MRNGISAGPHVDTMRMRRTGLGSEIATWSPAFK